jgi:hypothetical protein
MDLPPISAKIQELAEEIAGDALASDDKDFRLDAFKALSTFFIGVTKLSAKMSPDDEEGTSSVPAMRAKLKSVGGS